MSSGLERLVGVFRSPLRFGMSLDSINPPTRGRFYRSETVAVKYFFVAFNVHRVSSYRFHISEIFNYEKVIYIYIKKLHFQRFERYLR